MVSVFTISFFFFSSNFFLIESYISCPIFSFGHFLKQILLAYVWQHLVVVSSSSALVSMHLYYLRDFFHNKVLWGFKLGQVMKL